VITLHGWDISYSMLVAGVGQGLAYAVLAAGIVLIYRASGVINFAQGALGIFGVSLMAVMLGFVHMPYFLALGLMAVACALVGAACEFTFIRKLFTAPRLVLLLATLGISQIIQFGAGALPDLEVAGPFPTIVPWQWEASPRLLFQSRDISVMLVSPLLIIGLGLFLSRTRQGLMIRASASNSDKSRLNGIRVRRSSTMVSRTCRSRAPRTWRPAGRAASTSCSGPSWWR
jgi:branched-subunit amino acid ABC-type transport system permease component